MKHDLFMLSENTWIPKARWPNKYWLFMGSLLVCLVKPDF